MKEKSSKQSQTGLEIAVIGMSGRFPGAKDIHTFLAFIDCRDPAAHLNKKPIEFSLDSEKHFLKRLFTGTEMEEKLEKITDINRIRPLINN